MNKQAPNCNLHKTYADIVLQNLIDRVCAKYSFDGKMYLPYNVVRAAVHTEIETLKKSN